MDNALWYVILAIPQQAQRQYSTDEQLRYLMAAANKLGLYDAADRIRNSIGDQDGCIQDCIVGQGPTQEELHDADPSRCTFPCEVCASRNEDYLRKYPNKEAHEDWRDVRAARDFGRD